MTLKTPVREAPSWLEITQENGQLQARMVSRWGHARPLPKCELSNGQLTFVSPKEEEERKNDMVFVGKLSGKELVGTTTGPDGTPWTWTGERAPSLKKMVSVSEVGNADTVIQRERFERLDGERPESNAGMDSRKRNAHKSRARS